MARRFPRPCVPLGNSPPHEAPGSIRASRHRPRHKPKRGRKSRPAGTCRLRHPRARARRSQAAAVFDVLTQPGSQAAVKRACRPRTVYVQHQTLIRAPSRRDDVGAPSAPLLPPPSARELAVVGAFAVSQIEIDFSTTAIQIRRRKLKQTPFHGAVVLVVS